MPKACFTVTVINSDYCNIITVVIV